MLIFRPSSTIYTTQTVAVYATPLCTQTVHLQWLPWGKPLLIIILPWQWLYMPPLVYTNCTFAMTTLRETSLDNSTNQTWAVYATLLCTQTVHLQWLPWGKPLLLIILPWPWLYTPLPCVHKLYFCNDYLEGNLSW